MNLKDIVVLSETPEDEALLDRVEDAYSDVRATTKNIKYDDTAIEILSKVGSIADELSNEEILKEIEYLERAVFDAKNKLESSIYELEAPFEDLIRTLKNKIDDEELDREYMQKYGEKATESETMLGAMNKPIADKGPFQYQKHLSPFQNFELYTKKMQIKQTPQTFQDFKMKYEKAMNLPDDDFATKYLGKGKEYYKSPKFMPGTSRRSQKLQSNEAQSLNPAMDAEFINWLRKKGEDQLFPFTLGDLDNPEILTKAKQMYYDETGLYPGDGGATATPAARQRAKDSLKDDVDLNDKMIGEPDNYYDAEERKIAYKELQDALDRCSYDWERELVMMGACPNCAGSGYQDGEDEVWDDDEDDYVEGNECDGWGNYGCDEGEMTYRNDTPSWSDVMKHDERNADRKKSREQYPGDEVVIKQLAQSMKGMSDPRRAGEYLQHDYPFMGRAQRGNIVGKAIKIAFPNEDVNMKSNITMQVEGTNTDKAADTVINDFGDALDEFSSEEELDVAIHDRLNQLAKKYDFDHQDAYDKASAELQMTSGYPGSIDREYDARYEDISGGGQSSPRKPVPVKGQKVTLDNEVYVVTHVSADRKTFDVKNVKDDNERHIDVKVDRNPFFIEGKSPHKKGTKKYKKHMAAMHAGESITSGSTRKNTRLQELSPRRDNSANEMKVAELLKKAIKDPKGEDAYDLYAELESENPELAELYKDVALHQYEVQLEEGVKDVLKKGAIAGGVIAMLLGLNSMAPTAKDGALGQALKAHVLASGEDSDLAKHYYNVLDVYADEGDQRTLINLNIKFNPKFKTNRAEYDPSRQDVEDFLRKQAKLPEPTNERKYRDQGAADIVVGANGKEYIFNKDKKMFISTNTAEPGGPERVDISTKIGKDLLRRRRNQMARTEPINLRGQDKVELVRSTGFAEGWTPKQAGKKYWWE